jgi:hypothetical protein
MNSRAERRGWIASLLEKCSATPRAPKTLKCGAVTTDVPLLNAVVIPDARGEFEAADPHRNWPVSLDEVPAWRLDDEWVAEGRGYKLPSYRTRREFEAMVARCEAALAVAGAAAPLLDPLPANEAAVQFLAWLRTSGRTGTLSNEALSGLYTECCAAHNRAPTADNSLREALKRLPGVTKQQPNLKSDGRRHRPIFWIISPSPMVSCSSDRETMAWAA